MINEYISSLPGNGQKETWKDLGIRPPSGIIKKDFHKGTDPKSTVSVRFHGDYKYDRTENHMIRSLSDALNIIFVEKIREEQSGVYTINASYNTNKLQALFSVLLKILWLMACPMK